MKRKRLSVERIAHAIARSGSGTAVAEICRQAGVFERSICRWKRKYSGIFGAVLALKSRVRGTYRAGAASRPEGHESI